jgi:hypothetical protein
MSTLHNAVNNNLPPGYVGGLNVVWASTTTLTINTGVTRDSTNAQSLFLTSTKTITSTTSGAGGLDTGSVAASTLYYVYLIFGASGYAGLYSLSASSPTMPSGYTYFRRLGATRTDGSSHFIPYISTPGNSIRIIQYDAVKSTVLALNGGASTTFASVSLSLYMPSTSQCVILNSAIPAPASAVSSEIFFRATGSSLTATTTPYTLKTSNVGTNLNSEMQIMVPTNSSQSVDYAVSSAIISLDLYVSGWIDQL